MKKENRKHRVELNRRGGEVLPSSLKKEHVRHAAPSGCAIRFRNRRRRQIHSGDMRDVRRKQQFRIADAAADTQNARARRNEAPNPSHQILPKFHNSGLRKVTYTVAAVKPFVVGQFSF